MVKARKRSDRCYRWAREGLQFRWCEGARIINVYQGSRNIDAFSFGYGEGDERPTLSDAKRALERHMRYRRGEGVSGTRRRGQRLGLSGYLSVVPAYGRDYKSAKEVKAAWEAGKDFQIMDMSSPDDGRYINKQDAEKPGSGVSTLTIRYKRMTQVAVVKVRK